MFSVAPTKTVVTPTPTAVTGEAPKSKLTLENTLTMKKLMQMDSRQAQKPAPTKLGISAKVITKENVKPIAVNTKIFDLKESLQKPLPYKPHTGSILDPAKKPGKDNLACLVD